MRGQHSWRAGIRVTAMAAAMAAAVAVAGPAYPQIWTGASSDGDLQYRLSVIDAELADIRARLGGAPAAGGAVATGAGGDVMLRLNRMEAEIRRLTGKIEQMAFEQRSVAEDAARRFGDFEFRLTELEGGDISALAPVAPLGGGTSGSFAAAAGPEVSISERGDLDRAIKDVKKGRFDQGEDRLRGFLTTYPGSPLKSEALYWLGESQFVRGAFQNAARSYLNGYNTDRVSASAPKNLYRLGVTLGRLGQLNEACLTLREVRKKFPTGPADILNAADAESSALNCG
jgi:tol-pal system protein YbgF